MKCFANGWQEIEEEEYVNVESSWDSTKYFC